MSMSGNYLEVTPNELESLLADPTSISDFIYSKKHDEIESIDKAWHTIHFTLTGKEYYS